MVDEVTLSEHIQKMVSGDDGLMAEYDTQTLVEADPDAAQGTPEASPQTEDGGDGVLDGNEINTMAQTKNGSFADAMVDLVVTDLNDTFGGVANEAVLREEIKGVFEFDGDFSKADTNTDGKLSADEIISALDSVISVEDISIVNQTEFGEEKDLPSVEAAAGNNKIFAGVTELSTYFDGIGLSEDDATEVATILFQDEALKADTGGITAATILAFMNGSLSSDEQTEDPATFDTFKTSVETILDDATVFESNAGGDINEAAMLNLAGLSGETEDVDLDLNDLETLYVNMGETAAEAAKLAEWSVNFVHATDDSGNLGVSGTATSVNSTDLLKYIASHGTGNQGEWFGQPAFDAFTAHAETQMSNEDGTEYVNEGAFDQAIDNYNLEGSGILDETGLTNALLDLGVSSEYAGETASFLMENVGGSDDALGDGEFRISDLNTYFENGHTNTEYYDEGGLTAANLNMLVAGILDGTAPSRGDGNYSYEDGFSQDAFKAAANYTDPNGADETDNTVDNVDLIGLVENAGIEASAEGVDYDSDDIANILITLGIEPALAPDVGSYLVEQVGMYGKIPSEQLFLTLARIQDQGGNNSDDVIRADDITTLIANFNDNVEMTQIVPVDDTDNVTAGDIDTENSFVYVSASDADNADDDPSAISLTELTMVGDNAGITEEPFDTDSVEAILLAIGVDLQKAQELAPVIISQYGTDTDDDGVNDGISYAEMLDTLSGGEETLSIDALQKFIDDNEDANLLPTETELTDMFSGETYFDGSVFDLTDSDNADSIATKLAEEFNDPDKLMFEAGPLADMIMQKNTDLDGADFTVAHLYEVLEAYAAGERSLNGEVSGAGSADDPYALETSLEDLTIAELESLGDDGIADEQYIQTNGTKYLVTEDGGGNYILQEVDEAGEIVDGGTGRVLIADETALYDYDPDKLTDGSIYSIERDDGTQANLVQLDGVTYELDADGNVVGEANIIEDGTSFTLGDTSASTGEGLGTANSPYIFSGSVDAAAIEGLEGFADANYESGDTFHVRSNDGTENEANFKVTVHDNNFHLERLDTQGHGSTGSDYVFARDGETIGTLGADATDGTDFENQIVKDTGDNMIYVDADGIAYEISESGEIGEEVTITDGVADSGGVAPDGGTAPVPAGAGEWREGLDLAGDNPHEFSNVNGLSEIAGLLSLGTTDNMSELTDEQKEELAYILYAIATAAGDDAFEFTEEFTDEEQILNYIDGLDGTQTLESWFEEVDINNSDELYPHEIHHAVTGDVSVEFTDKTIDNMTQADFDGETIDWNYEKDGIEHGIMRVDGETYDLKYDTATGKYMYRDPTSDNDVEFPETAS